MRSEDRMRVIRFCLLASGVLFTAIAHVAAGAQIVTLNVPGLASAGPGQSPIYATRQR